MPGQIVSYLWCYPGQQMKIDNQSLSLLQIMPIFVLLRFQIKMSTKGLTFSGLVFLLTFMKLAISCSSDTCLENTVATVKASFYKTGTDTPSPIDSLTIYGAGNDSTKIYDNAKNISKISLPLNTSSGSSKFVLKINNVTDTMILYYTNYPYLISSECGISFFSTLDPLKYYVYGNRVDTIIFKTNNVTTFDEENIRIFY